MVLVSGLLVDTRDYGRISKFELALQILKVKNIYLSQLLSAVTYGKNLSLLIDLKDYLISTFELQ